jgi:3-keto-5-aminohexanoate cleavage enzyme
MSDPALIVCSINGLGLGKKPHTPAMPSEIATEALACIAAGAAIIHNHVDRVNVSGEESAARYVEGWRPVLAERPDALFYPTVNWDASGTIVYDHLAPLAASGLCRIGLNDVGSVNVGEVRDGLPAGGRVYTNSFDETAERFQLCGRLGLGAAVQILEASALRTVVRWWKAGQLPRGCFLNFYFYADPIGAGPHRGVWALPPTPTALALLLEMLGDCPLPWAVSVWQDDPMHHTAFLRHAIERGGGVNVGLESFGGTTRNPTNPELIAEIAGLCQAAGRAVASPTDAARLLALPAPPLRAAAS